MSNVRLRFRYVLLTYAQCGDLDPVAVAEHLGGMGAEFIIGRESHADGGIHFHAFAMWKRRFESRNVRVFDVAGCHPNIKPVGRTPEAAYDYAIKEGDVVGGELARPGGDSVPEAGGKWATIVAATSRDEFFDLVAQLDPRTLCTAFGNLVKYADHKYREERLPYSSPDGITFCTDRSPELDDWVQRNLVGDYVGKPATPERSGGPFTGFARFTRLSPQPSLLSYRIHNRTWR